MKDKENKKNIASLLNDLKNMALLYAKVKVAYECTKAKENVIDGVKNIRETCKESAKEFGVNLEDASQKYDDARRGVRQIEEKYKSTLDKMRKEYNARIRANAQEIVEAEAERNSISEKIFDVLDNRENVQEPKADREEKESELKKNKKELIKASKEGDFEKVSECVEKCKNLEKEIKKLENDYDGKLAPYDETLEKLDEEYDKADEKVKALEDLSKQMEKEFEKECKEASKLKKQELSLVKSNGFMDRIKGLFSKGLLKTINGPKKFQEQFLNPAMDTMSSYASQVPGKMKEAREKCEEKMKEITGKGKEALWIAKEVTVEKLLDAKDAIVYGATVVKDKAVDVATGTKNVAVGVARGVKSGVISFEEKVNAAYMIGTAHAQKQIDEMRNGLADGIISATDKIREKAEKIRPDIAEKTSKTYEAGEME